MSRRVALAVMFAVAVAFCACGKYGPPVRTVDPKSSETSEAAYPEPAVEEETVAPEADFDDAEADEENDQ